MHDNKLRIKFAGLDFINPFILASAPPTTNGEMIQRAFDAGWGGAIIKTLCYDLSLTQNVSPRIHALKSGKKITAFSNFELGSPKSIEEWLQDINVIKNNYPDNILLVSLLHTEQLVQTQWEETVKKCEDAGIDGFELNFSCSHGMAEKGGGGKIAESTDKIKMVTGWVKNVTKLPVMIKFPATVEGLPSKAAAAKLAGADAISAINSVNSLSEVNIYDLIPRPAVDGKSALSGLSGPAIRPIGLRSVAQIAQSVDIPISGIGGIYSWEDAVQYILVGASTVQICSAVMQNGYGIIKKLTSGLINYLEKMQFNSIDDFVGKSLINILKHKDLSREYKVVSALNEKLCNKCKMCLISCRDSAYQAISLNEEGYPLIDKIRCDGCGLCVQVCPQNALYFE